MQRNKQTKAQRRAKEREDRIRVMEPGDAEVVAAGPEEEGGGLKKRTCL